MTTNLLKPHIMVVYCVTLLSALVYSSTSVARDWQIMLIPDQLLTQQALDNVSLQSPIERGLSLSLSRSQGTLIDKQKVFSQCHLKWCGETNIDALFTSISTKAPNVQLVLLYSLLKVQDEHNHDYILQIKLVDPLSFEYRISEQLSLLETISPKSLSVLAQDAGVLVSNRLSSLSAQNRFAISLTGFTFDELKDLDSFLLSNTANRVFTLRTSTQTYTLLNRYLPTLARQYQLFSTLDAKQLNQMLISYFRNNQGINIEILQPSSEKLAFQIKRQANPYVLLMLCVSLFFLLLLFVSIVIIRRQWLMHKLQIFDQQGDADNWLDIYRKSQFSLYFLHSQYAEKARYWLDAQRQSASLTKQAKIYLELGDTHTANLFIQKSLTYNAQNKKAIGLANTIKREQHAHKKRSINERRISSKISKAMHYFRQQEGLKALRKLYQAHAIAKRQISLKKQAKAIQKLIKKVNHELSTAVQAVSLTNAHGNQVVNICHRALVHLGRMPIDAKDSGESGSDDYFSVNHKAISKIGKQSSIEHTVNGFAIVDYASKNGTFINNNACVEKHLYELQNNDLLQLGGTSIITSVIMKVAISENKQCLHLHFSSPATALLTAIEIEKMWPGHAMALQQEFVCTKRGLIIAFDEETQRVEVCSLDAQFSRVCEQQALNNSSVKNKRLVALCTLTLGSNASIQPYANIEGLRVGSATILGKVPLTLPCTLNYRNVTFTLAKPSQQDFKAEVPNMLGRHEKTVNAEDVRSANKTANNARNKLKK